MSQHHHVIVIGAGVAGLACSVELRKQGVAHAVIATNVGGRVTLSADGVTNYGSYIIGGDNKHILPLVTLGRRLRLHHVRFHGAGATNFWSAWKHPLDLWRFWRAVQWFQDHYHTFQRRAEQIGQRVALQEDEALFALYTEPATIWLQRHQLASFAREFIDPIVRMCTFSKVEDISALEFFHVAMYMTIPVFEFTTSPDQLKAGERAIMLDDVVGLTPGTPHEIVTKGHGTLTADAVVVATPIDQTCKLLSCKYDKTGRSAWMYHLRGQVKESYRGGDLHIFRQPDNTLFLSRQSDGTFLCYRLINDRGFAELFEGSVEVIATRYWNPGFWLGGTSLLDVAYGPNLFLAGDHNIVGMEDAYISGLAAARAIASTLA